MLSTSTAAQKNILSPQRTAPRTTTLCKFITEQERAVASRKVVGAERKSFFRPLSFEVRFSLRPADITVTHLWAGKGRGKWRRIHGRFAFVVKDKRKLLPVELVTGKY